MTMKKLLMIALMTAFAAQLSAATANNSWETLESTRGISVEWPTVNLDNGPMVTVNNVCYDGEQLQTTSALKTCVDWANPRRGQRECNEYGYYTGVAQMNGYNTVCTDWTARRGQRICNNYEDQAYTVALDYNVAVYSKTFVGNGEFEYDFLFEKAYSVPSCK
jgi:hypothetical protein